jgi:spermidine/putrescine transport system substrate-binding protein
MTQPKRPLSPEAAAIVRAQLSRRSVLAGALGIGALTACGTSGTPESSGAKPSGSASSDGKPKPAADRSATEKKVDWANWTLYLDYDEETKKYPTLEAFQKQTGIAATYAEDIEDNDSYYGKVSGQLKNGQDIGKDIIVMTDWMAARLIRQGYVQKLDAANIPNKKNIAKAYASPDYDPGRDYSLTWQGGFAGIAWNKEKVPGGLKSVQDLWKPELKGRVEVLSEMRRHHRPDHGLAGRRHRGRLHRRPVHGRGRRAAEAREQRSDPLGEGELLQGGPHLRRRAGGHRLVR